MYRFKGVFGGWGWIRLHENSIFERYQSSTEKFEVCVYNCLFISVHQIAIFLHMADPG